ncbi:MAG TPA: AbrB/MazE/SpoVT family DNA-binding domain-containing protein [Ktedonobacterales bacterium]|nr:AbrB/MazE/SpoVT family DNA-binding domain-containing protein [Ktedonobacterales bacterium]
MAETTHISEGGRIVIPAEFRRALGLHVGDEVVLRLEDGELRLYTVQQAIARAQQIVAAHVGNTPSMADELIAERRAEAERE